MLDVRQGLEFQPQKLAENSNATVLITGETGTGKSCLAREIHRKSSRAVGPFVTVNLASLHEGTLESEIFGHERGSFTGADRKVIGKLERANRGTVFLDEVGELSLKLQARLLDFIQSKKISPLGSQRETELDVRIIAATHRNLEKEVKNGLFREDLFYRLRVIPIPLKPLRERIDEFDSIVHKCLQELCAHHGKPIRKIEENLAKAIEVYGWPGNIRELRNVLEFAVIACGSDELKFEHLPEWFKLNLTFCSLEEAGLSVRWLTRHGRSSGSANSTLGIAAVPLSVDFQETFNRFEKFFLETVLDQNDMRIGKAAREIGVNRTTLLRRLREHQLWPVKRGFKPMIF